LSADLSAPAEIPARDFSPTVFFYGVRPAFGSDFFRSRRDLKHYSASHQSAERVLLFRSVKLSRTFRQKEDLVDRKGQEQEHVTVETEMTTVIGAVLMLSVVMVAAAWGATRPNVMMNGSTDLEVSMRWVQPILGRAIVEDSLIKQRTLGEVSRAVRVLNGTSLNDYYPHGEDRRILESDYIRTIEADHDARVQWVLGRLIVELTRHRLGAGDPAADRLADEGNQRIIAIARQTAREFDEAFRTAWQARIGRAIVAGSADRSRPVLHDPEEVGLIF
jgi:hypothetical protein